MQYIRQNGVGYALYLHTAGEKPGERRSFLLEPFDDKLEKWTAKPVAAAAQFREALPKGTRLMHLFADKHHNKKITIDVRLPE